MKRTLFSLSVLSTIVIALALSGELKPQQVSTNVEPEAVTVLPVAATDFCSSPNQYTTDPPQGPIACQEPCTLDYDCVEGCRNAYRGTMTRALRVAYASCAANEAAFTAAMEVCRATHRTAIDACGQAHPQGGAELDACLADAAVAVASCYNNAIAARDNGRISITKTFEETEADATRTYWDCTLGCCHCEK